VIPPHGAGKQSAERRSGAPRSTRPGYESFLEIMQRPATLEGETHGRRSPTLVLIGLALLFLPAASGRAGLLSPTHGAPEAIPHIPSIVTTPYEQP
jgi:hypothetical protein